MGPQALSGRMLTSGEEAARSRRLVAPIWDRGDTSIVPMPISSDDERIRQLEEKIRELAEEVEKLKAGAVKVEWGTPFNRPIGVYPPPQPLVLEEEEPGRYSAVVCGCTNPNCPICGYRAAANAGPALCQF